MMDRAMSCLILIILFLLLIGSKPKMRTYLPYDASHLSHERTNTINAIFIIIIVLRHIAQRIVPFDGIDFYYHSYFNGPAGQSIVSTFFVFSGYGIMLNILKKKNAYIRELMNKRFATLYVNMVICAFISATAYILMAYSSPSGAFIYAFKTCIGVGGLWFIVMTLVIYVLTWSSFRICGSENPTKAILLSMIFIYGACVALIPFKPLWWLDTELCFPCGMLFALYREPIERFIRKTKVPILIVGLITLFLGWKMMYINSKAVGYLSFHLNLNGNIRTAIHIFTYPLCTVVFVLGIVWTMGAFYREKYNQFIVWLGGVAVFYIFCLHFIAIRFFEVNNLHQTYPKLTILGVVLASIGMAYAGHKLIPRIDKLIFRKQ